MTLLFYYTLLIMFFYTIVAATSLSAFYVSQAVYKRQRNATSISTSA